MYFTQRVLFNDPAAFEAKRLQTVEGKDVRRWMDWTRPLPLEEERARLVREIGHGLEPFQGSAANLIRSAGRSVLTLMSILTREFPGFRDQAVYNGQQVFLYKRAQIFAGDVWGSFGGMDLGEFHDIHELTMFPDYRVPQLLLHLGILEYSPTLLKALSNRELLEAGSSMEVEIRAASVMAVEAIKDEIKVTFGEDSVPMSIQLDWWLWEKAELEGLDDALQHRTLTLFY